MGNSLIPEKDGSVLEGEIRKKVPPLLPKDVSPLVGHRNLPRSDGQAAKEMGNGLAAMIPIPAPREGKLHPKLDADVGVKTFKMEKVSVPKIDIPGETGTIKKLAGEFAKVHHISSPVSDEDGQG
jgi:hypothetical protein